ncbi:MAG TPA: flavodoxin [Lachnospiraceae bacterium]|nr:flavodoxin [Lachnospiraceae bacterium]
MLTGCGSATGNGNAGRGVQSSTSAATQTTESSVAATESATAETVATQETAAETQTGDTTAESESGKILVVYYSASGTTKRVATAIADATGADLYEITPVEPYTSDDLNWTNSSSRVSREHDDESLRDIALTEITPTDWDSYDTVLIGYPIWWGIAAWPVDNFVKGNDFTGKTVIPFCTSSSSGLGDSGNLLEEMAGTGDWQEGHRFSSGASDADAADWVASLNLNE